MEVHILLAQSFDRSYYKAISQIFSNALHHCLIFWLLLISLSIHKPKSGICLRGCLWFALSFNGIRPGQPWFFCAICLSPIPFVRPADRNASPVKAILLQPTFHAIPLRARVLVAVQNGPAYRMVSALNPSKIMALSALVADPALINCGLLVASAQVSALIPHVSRWPAMWMNV